MKKALFFGSFRPGGGGFSTFEVLIAFALLVVSIAIAAEMVFGGVLVSYGFHARNQATRLAAHALEVARATVSMNPASVVAVSDSITIASTTYTRRVGVRAVSQCSLSATSSVTWSEGLLRAHTFWLETVLLDVQGVLLRGGDCDTAVIDGDWTNYQIIAQGVLPVGKPTTIDVLDGVIYMGSSVSPYLFIADARAVRSGDSIEFVSFANNFKLPQHIVSLDVVRQRSPSGESGVYVYAAMNTPQEQLQVIDVTDIHNPVLIARRSLQGVSVTGSEPMGHRILYYAPRVYISTKYTAGPELHTFDVSDPHSPVELGGGVELGTTVNALALQTRVVEGEQKRFLYAATSQLHSEVRVFDVTDSLGDGSVGEILAATVDLPGSQNAQSLFILGEALYVGRASTPSGPDLYVFSMSNPFHGLLEQASEDIGTGVMSLAVVSKRIFMLTSKVMKEMQTWNYDDEFTLESSRSVPGAMIGGFDLERGRLYVTGQGTSSVQIVTAQ